MRSDKWQQAKSIFNSALERRPEDRDEYLADVCHGDDSLRGEVEQLIASYRTDFLEPAAPGQKGDGDREAQVLRFGDRIGHYEVIRLLGLGGMGEVYLVRDESLERLACLKVLSLDQSPSAGQLERFVREARSSSGLNHPHICTVYEINTENGPPFIAMEYVEGQTLAEKIAHKKFDPQEAVDIAVQIASGLAEAHDAGIVHRDIKPANIIINKRGQVKIVDFGLAKKFIAPPGEQTQKALTHSGTIVGTISYMSPEQARGQLVDARTDVWSLGVVLYEMLTGKHPFAGETTGDIIASILRSEPGFAADVGGLPPEVERVLKTSLSKERGSRYTSARQMAHELEKAKTSLLVPGHKPPQNGTTAILPANRGAVPPPSHVSASRLLSPAYDLYMRGRIKASSENHEEVEAAINLLEDAVKLDPSYAEAYAALAMAYTTKAFQFAADTEKKQIAENAEVAVEKALALNPNLAEGHFARGVVLWTHAKRFPHEQAIQAYKRAIELNPNLDEAHHRLGLVYFHVGLLDQAREEVRKALAINPNNTMARFRMGTIDAHQGKYEDAIAIFKTIPRAVSPSIVDRATSDALVHLGRLKEASALVEDYLKKYPKDVGGNVSSVKAILLAKAGKRGEAKVMISRAIEIGRGFGHFHHTAYNLASAYAILNEPDESVKWLRDASDDGFPCYTYFEHDENLDQIRNDPGFIGFMSEMKHVYERRVSELFAVHQASNAEHTTGPEKLGSFAVAQIERARTHEPTNRAARKDAVPLQIGLSRLFAVGPVRLYAAVAALLLGIFVFAWYWRPLAQVPRPEIKSLAVLPLENLSGDPSQEYFADGMTDELITEIAKLGDLQVISRGSVMRFKNTTVSVPDIARQLGVDAVLTGSVVRAGDRARITVQLIRADTDRHLWAETYERDLRDVLLLQRDIALNVGQQISTRLAGQQRLAAQGRRIDPMAHEAYLKGLYFSIKSTPESKTRALDYFTEATRISPIYPEAHAKIAECYRDLGGWYAVNDRNEALTRARAAVTEALQQDEALADAHVVLGYLNQEYEWNWQAAEREFRRAIEINPSYAAAHIGLAKHLLLVGRLEEVPDEVERARRADPLSLPDIGLGAWTLEYTGQHLAAIERMKTVVQMDPNIPITQFQLGLLYMDGGELDQAAGQFRTAIRMYPAFGKFKAHLAYVLARSGDKQQARKLLDEMLQEHNVVSFDVGLVMAGLGEQEQAIDWLEKAYQERSIEMIYMRILATSNTYERAFFFLRENPRFKDLMRRMNFSEPL